MVELRDAKEWGYELFWRLLDEAIVHDKHRADVVKQILGDALEQAREEGRMSVLAVHSDNTGGM